MTVDIRSYVNAKESDQDALNECVLVATALVDAFVGLDVVPQVILDECYLRAAKGVFDMRKAKNGVQQFATADDVVPVRTGYDPMAGCYALLRPFVIFGDDNV